MNTPLTRIEFPELFYGIVSPVGVNVAPTISELEEYLKGCGYEVQVIKVTKTYNLFKRKFKPYVDLQESPFFERLDTFIKYGNQLRYNFEDPSILAIASIFQISNDRKKEIKRNDRYGYEKRAYVIHQFKRREEVDLLRAIYGNLFTQISIYSRKENRIEYVAKKIASDESSADIGRFRPKAEALINRDQDEVGKPYGQRISKIFHDADLIINDDIDAPSPREQVRRFLELQFSSNSISPSKMEYGMFSAKSAALRTLDLSRQVGAAIFQETGEIISMGSNEVPKAGGGTYWSGGKYDDREYKRGVDSNDERKLEILKEIYRDIGNIVEIPMTFDDFKRSEGIKNSRFMDALEYGRIIHAEMAAITDAARLGRKVEGSVLFCTTFPCHMCAKHIVASGVKSVVFLEPYPKSLTSDLHSDSIEVEGSDRGRYESYPSVSFEHFYGVTPRRYRELFERGKRKEGVKFQDYIDGVRRPNIDFKIPYYVNLENELLRQAKVAYERRTPMQMPVDWDVT